MIDSALNMENMPLASTAIRTCFWGGEWFWLDRNRELSRSVPFPSLTPPSLFDNFLQDDLNFFSPVSLIQIFPWTRTQMGTFSDPVSLNVCELREKETESDLQPGSGRRATVKGAGIVCVITASLSACLFIVIVLSPYWCSIHFLITSVKGNLAKVTLVKVPNQ